MLEPRFTRKMRRGSIPFVICLLLSLQNAFAHETDELSIAVFHFPPFYHYAEDGTLSGTHSETVKVMCEIAEIQCKFIMLPLKRAYENFKNKKIDAMITINSAELSECCVHTNWHTPWAAGFFSTRPLSEIPRFPDDLRQSSLIVVNGMRSPYEFAPKLEEWNQNKEVTLIKSFDIASAVRKFINKRSDLLWGSEDYNWYFEKMSPETRKNFLPLMVKPVVLWTLTEKSHLRDKLDQAFGYMRTNAMLEKHNMLRPELMHERYKDAPFRE